MYRYGKLCVPEFFFFHTVHFQFQPIMHELNLTCSQLRFKLTIIFFLTVLFPFLSILYHYFYGQQFHKKKNSYLTLMKVVQL